LLRLESSVGRYNQRMTLHSRLRGLRRLTGNKRTIAVRAGFVAGLLALEALGRHSASDIGDLLGVSALAAVVTIWLAYDASAKQAIARLARRGGAALVDRMPTVGLDLRGEPVLPRGEPAVFRWFGGIFALCTALELGWILGVGAPFREFVLRGSYTIMMLLTGLLWSALLVVITLSICLAYIAIHDTMRTHYGDWPHRRRRIASMVGYGVIAASGIAFLPQWIALACLGAGIALYPIAGTLDPPPRLRLLWRERDGSVGSFDLYQWIVAQAVLIGWPAAILVVAGLGDRAFGIGTGHSTPITTALATAAIWCAGPAMMAVAVFSIGMLHRSVRRDPARRCPTTVHLTPTVPAGEQRRAQVLLEARGWRVRWSPEPVERADVQLRLVERVPAGRVEWPLMVSAATLELAEVLDLIARRDIIQRRRFLLRGLERMLKRARRQDYASGNGFWIAPQHWFVVGITRDTEEEDHVDDSTYADSMIGAPYHAVIPQAARRHAHDVFAAIEIDIVFVEDGVTWRRLRGVLRRIFSHFDAREGRIEERHLHGLPGIRAIVHDLRIGEPLDRERYPEPDYEDLGRARILHIFRDRGEEEELEPEPTVDEGVPLHA
jgi:hypothetical protein